MKRSHLIICLILLSLLPSIRVIQGQTNSKINFRILSVPDGALITVNGKVVGRGGMILPLDPGTYNFRLSFPGFNDFYANNYPVSSTQDSLIAELPDGPSFVRLDSHIPNFSFFDLAWIGFSNRIRIFGTSTSTLNRAETYDADTQGFGAMATVASPDTSAIRQQLHLTDEKVDFSPSGRYLAYRDKKNIGLLYIFDQKTGKMLQSQINSSGIAPANLTWSINEQWARVDGDFGTAYYIHLTDDNLTVIDLSNFKLESGQLWTLYAFAPDRPLGLPSSKGLALVQARPWDTRDISSDYLCIVDLNTQVGVQLPVVNPIGAMFSRDETTVYIINAQGVSRYNIATQKVELLDSGLSNMTTRDSGLLSADISPTTDYAIISQQSDSIRYWAYKVPHSASP